jgi:hypothetical protein
MQHKNIPKAFCQKYFKLQISKHSTELLLFLQNQLYIEILLNENWTSYCGNLSLVKGYLSPLQARNSKHYTSINPYIHSDAPSVNEFRTYSFSFCLHGHSPAQLVPAAYWPIH